MKLKYLSFLILLVFALVEVAAQSKTFLQLKVEDKVERTFYFYPSTLRMLNLQQNPQFNALIKDIRKLIFFRMRRDSFDSDQFSNVLLHLKQDESFDDYIEIQGRGQQLYVLGKEKPYNTVILAEQKDQFYLAEIIGKINVLQIPNLYSKISEGDSTFQDGFINIFDMMRGSNQEEHHEENSNPAEVETLPKTATKT